jgi:hypothetical protein
MRHPPGAKGAASQPFARHRQFLCPSTIDPKAKTPARRERQIDQFEPELLSGVMIPRHQQECALGCGMLPFNGQTLAGDQ